VVLEDLMKDAISASYQPVGAESEAHDRAHGARVLDELVRQGTIGIDGSIDAQRLNFWTQGMSPEHQLAVHAYLAGARAALSNRRMERSR
jgi:hypothetical protein